MIIEAPSCFLFFLLLAIGSPNTHLNGDLHPAEKHLSSLDPALACLNRCKLEFRTMFRMWLTEIMIALAIFIVRCVGIGTNSRRRLHDSLLDHWSLRRLDVRQSN